MSTWAHVQSIVYWWTHESDAVQRGRAEKLLIIEKRIQLENKLAKGSILILNLRTTPFQRGKAQIDHDTRFKTTLPT